MDDNQFILSSIPLRQLNTMISVAVNEAMKSYKPEKAEQQEPTERLLTVHEAAKFLNLTTATIYSKVSRGELPVMKRSKRLYFSNIELMNYLKEGRKKTYSEIDAEAENYLNNKSK